MVVGISTLTVSAQSQSFQKTDSGLKIKIDTIITEFQFFSPSVLRVSKYPAHKVFVKNSLSVIAKPQKTDFTVKSDKELIILNTNDLKIVLNSKTGTIQYNEPSGKILMAEKDFALQPVKDLHKNTYKPTQRFNLPATDAIYGLGQHQEGIMNYRNHKVLLKQKNTEIAVPVILSSGGYGLFWDNYSATTFDDTKGITTMQSEVGDGIDYYFVKGRKADDVIAGIRKLTGEAPMFPEWVFGFWQSRERYTSQDELLSVVKKYRDLKVPLDGIVLDWQYWGKEYDTWNSTEFGNPSFPFPEKMVDSVHQMKAHVIISVWPSFGNRTAIYKEMDEKGLLYNFKTWPETAAVKVYDAFNPLARDIYWKHIKKNLSDIGIDGWWLDATEPEQTDPAQSDSTKTHLGSFRSLRNAYPLVSTGGIYDHQRAATSDKRVFILTRSAFAGQQRYATATWSGDIQSSWDVFRKQISGGLNLSLSGIPYWNTDIGGFFTAKYPRGINDPAFQELYTRWFEFAAFTPLFRSHGTGTPREIYQFGKKGDWAYDAQTKFIDLRYRLLPYIYSEAWQVTKKSSTMMRALVMDFASDKKVYDIDNEFMFGGNILVAPVTDSMYTTKVNGQTTSDFRSVKTRQLYLPEGTNWIDFWSGKTHNGGSTLTAKTPIDRIPLFIKCGAILPLSKAGQYSGQQNHDMLDLRIFPGCNGEYILYEDEKDNYNYEQGKFSTIKFIWNNRAKTLTVLERQGSFKNMLKSRYFNILLVNEQDGDEKLKGETGRLMRYEGKRISIKLK